MTITARVRKQMFQPAAPTTNNTSANTTRRQLIRIPLTRLPPVATTDSSSAVTPTIGVAWTVAEHERFLEGLEVFPTGPWRRVAEFVGTKNARQVMTHAQKYRQKIARRARSLQLLAHPQQQLPQSSDGREPVSSQDEKEDDVAPLSEQSESVKSPTSWDAAFHDLAMDWSLSSPQVTYSEQLLDCDDGSVSFMFQELMDDANNLPDELLLGESAALLTGEYALPSWSLSEAFAFVTPYEH